MQLRLAVIAGAIALGCLAKAAHAQTDVDRRIPDLVLHAVADIPQPTTLPRLGNAEVADTTQWQATFRRIAFINGVPRYCTGTLVAARTLLIAAHCVSHGGSIEVERVLGGQPKRFKGTCSRSPAFQSGDFSADWALCLMEADVPARYYERLRLSRGEVRIGSRLRLLGLGCTQAGTVSDGILRVGWATVAQMPGEVILSGTLRPQYLATPAGTLTGDSFLCDGDSGGPAYEIITDTVREIVAINSMSDESRNGVSYLGALWTNICREFVLEWAKRNGQSICGIHKNARGCR